MTDLPNSELRRLKAAAQHLEPSVRLGKNGITGELLATLDVALERQELVKVRLEAFKEQKRALARELATRSGSHLVMEVGHVVVLFRRRPAPATKTPRPA
jgi:RNA-binding protein